MPNKIKSMHLKHRLIQRLNNEKVELSYTLLAEYLLNHYDDLEDLNIEKICDDNYISISTLRRFCQSLGYDNFTDLKESQQDDYNDRRVLNINLEENINTLFQKYNYKNADIDDFIAYMKNYEHVFALFPSNLYSVTFNFQQQLLTLNKCIYLVPNIDFIFPYITKSLKDSLVIILDSNEEYTSSALLYLNDIDCKKIAISNHDSNTSVWDKQIIIPSMEQELLEKYVYSFLLDNIYMRYTQVSNEK